MYALITLANDFILLAPRWVSWGSGRLPGGRTITPDPHKMHPSSSLNLALHLKKVGTGVQAVWWPILVAK